MALAKSVRYRGGYDEVKETVIGNTTSKLLGWGAFDGEVEMELIYSTDDTVYNDVSMPTAGAVAAQSFIVIHYDSDAYWTSMLAVVYPRSIEVVDNEDAFARIRMTGTILSRPANPAYGA